MKTFCVNCGQVHEQENYPKRCKGCRTEMYKNPIPVAVVVVPVEDNWLKKAWLRVKAFITRKEVKLSGVLLIQRNIQNICRFSKQPDFCDGPPC